MNWKMPGSGAPCTSTSRPGRWRSFPYLADLEEEEATVLWDYLCREWDAGNNVENGNPGRKLLRFNFFMLQADVLPNMGFSSTRKRLVRSHECVPLVGDDERDDGEEEYAAAAAGNEGSFEQEENANLGNDAGNNSAGTQDEL